MMVYVQVMLCKAGEKARVQMHGSRSAPSRVRHCHHESSIRFQNFGDILHCYTRIIGVLDDVHQQHYVSSSSADEGRVDVPSGDVMRLWMEIEAEPLVSGSLDVGLHPQRLGADIEENSAVSRRWPTGQVFANKGIAIFCKSGFWAQQHWTSPRRPTAFQRRYIADDNAALRLFAPLCQKHGVRTKSERKAVRDALGAATPLSRHLAQNLRAEAQNSGPADSVAACRSHAGALHQGSPDESQTGINVRVFPA